MVIPTIVFNSSYAKNAALQKGPYRSLESVSQITYFDYGEAIKVFSLDDYDELVEQGKMFARKFDSRLSYSLMDRLKKDWKRQ